MPDQPVGRSVKWELCESCSGLRDRIVDRVTARYRITLPASCPTPDQCADAILKPFTNILRDPIDSK
jgi:hypothetical protein